MTFQTRSRRRTPAVRFGSFTEARALIEVAQPTTRSRWLALVVLCAGMLMIILDETIVNVALPAIQSDLGFTQSSLAWVVNAYLIAYGGLLLLFGRLGDLVGRKRILLIGLVVFVSASLVNGLSVNQPMLVAGRFVQGIGGAMAAALILGMIVAMFPEAREQATAIGIFSFVAAAGGAIGLLAGGILTQALSWHWIFFVNLPIGLMAIVLVVRLVDSDSGVGLGNGADILGALLITAALMVGVYTIVNAGAGDRSAMQAAGLGALALALAVAFVVRQAKARNPLLPLTIFRSRNVVGANLAQAFMVAGMFGMFFLGSLYLQRVLGYGALDIGLAFLPVAVAIGALSDSSGRLALRFGHRAVVLAGLALVVAGLVLFSRAPVRADYLFNLLPALVLIGIGSGLAFPALMGAAMADATHGNAGIASGLVNTSALVGGAFGLAILATLSAARTEHLQTGGQGVESALTGGYEFAFGVSAALVAIAAVMAATLMRPHRVA
jgi:EmrB/QacA subfamily drug resistance transporter